MATYVYQCNECMTQFEIVQSMNDEPLKHCETCEKDTLNRMIMGNEGGVRIGGGHNSTSMWNVSGDPGPRRKGYDCDPMN